MNYWKLVNRRSILGGIAVCICGLALGAAPTVLEDEPTVGSPEILPLLPITTVPDAQEEAARHELELLDVEAELAEAESRVRRAELERRRAEAEVKLIQKRRERLARIARIYEALARPIPFDFADEVPVSRVLEYFQERTVGEDLPHGVPIYVDPVGLMELEQTPQSPVTITVDEMAPAQTLRLILRQLDLVYRVHDGLIVVTSNQRAEALDACAAAP